MSKPTSIEQEFNTPNQEKEELAQIPFPKSMEALSEGLCSIADHSLDTPTFVNYGTTVKGFLFFDLFYKNDSDDTHNPDPEALDEMKNLYEELQVLSDGINVKLELEQNYNSLAVYFKDPEECYRLIKEYYEEYALLSAEKQNIVGTDPDTGISDQNLIACRARRLNREGEQIKRYIDHTKLLYSHPITHAHTETYNIVLAKMGLANASISLEEIENILHREKQKKGNAPNPEYNLH